MSSRSPPRSRRFVCSFLSIPQLSLGVHYLYLNGTLTVGDANNTIDLKIFFGHDKVFHNIQYVNTLGTDLEILSVEVSSSNLGLQYPSSRLLSSPDGASSFLGTLHYDPTEEYDACRSLLCDVLPARGMFGTELAQLPSEPSASMLDRCSKQKAVYQRASDSYESETLSFASISLSPTRRIRTNYAGSIDVHIHIYPKLVNLLHNPRHTLSSMISKGLFTLLSDLGFPLDWHAQTPSCSRHYRHVHGVEVDESLFYAYHAGPKHDGESLHCADLKESRSLSFDNAQHAIVQGQDVVLFSDTVLGTARTLTLTLFNPLEYPVLVRLAAAPDTREIAGFLPSNRSESIAIDAEAVLEGTIPSNGRLVLGPLTFTPTNLGVFSEYFMLFNNYTGLQPRICSISALSLVLLAGRCVEQPILIGDSAGLLNEVSPVSPFHG